MTSLWFFPNIIVAVVFLAYIGFGNSVTMDNGFMIMTLCELVQRPLRRLPFFINQLMELTVALRRIERFLKCDEINPSM